ncbi:alpha/beta hydrolase [Streptomyces sp. MI02-7b]|uniref:alpha/beta fold hydrolase n=1 Tax=Streptomyces sp. MI02-7b TaxID=462941 RepID=UPI0029A0D604|nr:alpha/beta hydrolase [Streptomyces sp. MI02-7b]MDX3074520.1 alpha/beta hydrolase [Streptomyces sp. MI02-7b]
MVTEADTELRDGRTLHFYDTGPAAGGDDLPVVWLHGTPNVGEPPEPLFEAAQKRGIRWFSYDRPGYGGSTPHPGRDIAAAAADVAAVADALGIERFAVLGHSGGGPHALACAALLPDRVVATVSGAGLAPYGAEGIDWFAGMCPSSVAELRASAAGRAPLEEYLAGSDYDPEMFTPADHAALADAWAWLASVAGRALQGEPDGMIDDDLAYVTPWGFDPAAVRSPVLLLHGGRDRMVPAGHAAWLARCMPTADLRVLPDEGHVSVLTAAPEALDWLVARASGRTPG